MEKQKQTSFTFEIDNLWEKKAVTSPKFISGGCEWFVDVYPKGLNIEDHLGLTLVLCVANPEALGLGWTGRAIFSFVLLNQSGKELYRVPERSSFFCDKFSKSGTSGILPLKKLKEKGVLEENKLTVIVQVKVVQVFGQGQGDVTEKEMFDDVKERIKNLILYMEKEEQMENLNVDPISIKEIKDWPKRVVRYWNEFKIQSFVHLLTYLLQVHNLTHIEYLASSASGAAFCRSAALILMALLLLRHALTITDDADGEEDDTICKLYKYC